MLSSPSCHKVNDVVTSLISIHVSSLLSCRRCTARKPFANQHACCFFTVPTTIRGTKRVWIKHTSVAAKTINTVNLAKKNKILSQLQILKYDFAVFVLQARKTTPHFWPCSRLLSCKKNFFFAAFGSEISPSEMLKMIKDEKHVCEICRPREMGTKHAQGWTNVSTAEERGALFSEMI